MDLITSLKVLKYYGNTVLKDYTKGYTCYDLKSMMDLEDAIDKVKDFIIGMGGKL